MLQQKRCVLVADDEARIIRALRDLLQANGFCVLSAGNGRETLQLFEQYASQIDLLLLDVMMPEGDGFSVLREIRAVSPQMPVIFLTARGTEYDQLEGFRSGADDYIPKPFSTRLLLARIDAVLRRSSPAQPDRLAAGTVALFPEQRRAEAAGQPLELTRREFDLLAYFLANPGQTLSREQLLQGVWGYDYEWDERTVDTHVKNLRSKLGACAGYLQTVYRIGYRFEAEE